MRHLILLLAVALSGCGKDDSSSSGSGKQWVWWKFDHFTDYSGCSNHPTYTLNGLSISFGQLGFHKDSNVVKVQGADPLTFSLVGNQIVGSHGYSWTWNTLTADESELIYLPTCKGVYKKADPPPELAGYQ